MEDTDWRPSPCPICGELREAARTPVCKNPNCEDPKSLTIYALYDWDGGDGSSNTFNGFITKSGLVARQWENRNVGASYKKISGTLIESMDNLQQEKIQRKKQKALDKLTDEEKKLLGL